MTTKSMIPFLLMGLIAGMLIPLIPVLNNTLNKFSGGLFQTIPLVFAVGLVASSLLGLLVLRNLPLPANLPAAPWYSLMSGIIMLIYLLTATFLTPRMGVGLTIGLIVSGQLLMAVLIDHLGLFGCANYY